MNNTFIWYSELIKPTWAPPSGFFGPVWAVLYTIILLTYSFVFYKAITNKIEASILLPLILNLIFNFAFSPIQFGLQNNLLAAIDISLVLITIIWSFISIYGIFPWFVYANIPYLLWVAFATALQFTITYLNK